MSKIDGWNVSSAFFPKKGKMIKPCFLISLLLTCLFVPSAIAASGPVTGGYHIDNGDNATINAHSVQKKVTNNHASGLTIYVPLNSAGEWSAYVASPPPGVTVENVCGGVSVGGYCWYYGGAGASCDGTCSGHGGCNLSGTRDYAGSGGSALNCQAVLDGLGVGSGIVWDNSNAWGYGCGYALSTRSRDIGTVTTCSGANGFASRACACNN